MAVKSNLYVPQLSQDTSRGPSPNVWRGQIIEDYVQDFSLGFFSEDDFNIAGNIVTTNAAGNVGKWATWIDTNGVLGADPADEGAALLLSDGGNSGVTLAFGSTAGGYRLVSAASGFPYDQPLAFECRVAVGSITTAKRDVFIGLVDNTAQATGSGTAVISGTTNTLTTTNGFIGFHFRSTTNPTDVGFVFNPAGGPAVYPTNLQTLSTTVVGSALTAYAAGSTGAVTGTGFIKLGFVFDPTPQNTSLLISSASTGQTAGTLARPVIRVYANGQQAPAFLTNTNLQAATFPSGFMAPFFGYKSRSGTSAGGLYIDWIRAAKLATF